MTALITLPTTHTSYAVTFFPNNYGKGIGLMHCPHWYVGANLGISHAFDIPPADSTDYVEHNGVGWSVDAGYQFLHIYGAMLGIEAGYTQYADSREYTRPSMLIARREHQSADLVGTLQLPIVCNLSLLGKLGAEYSYARTNAYPVNFSSSANVIGLYYGGGLMYDVTSRAAVIAQWARARGDGSTGTTDLYSLGVRVNLA